MLDRIPNASQALVEGYLVAAQLAEKRRSYSEGVGNVTEGRAWAKVARYCWMMAEYGLVDEPETLVNYLPFDENIFDRRLLVEIMDDTDGGTTRKWTTYHQMALNAAMALLSPQEREIALLYYAGQVKRDDVASMMHLSVRTVDKYIERINKEWGKCRF